MEERREARIGTVGGLALLVGATAIAAVGGGAHSIFATVLLGLLAIGLAHALLEEIRRQAQRRSPLWAPRDTINAVLLGCWAVAALITTVLAVGPIRVRAVGLLLTVGYAVSCGYLVTQRLSALPGRPAAPKVAGMRYRSSDEDSARWDGFPFRPGDIVISTRSKSGTTWAQMICALLVFQTPDLPAPLPELSPWLDWLIIPRDQVFARLEAQDHRRFIKTHTPLNGIPLDPQATYLVVARHPLDMAISLFHQSRNLNRARMAELIGTPAPTTEPPPPPPLHDSLLAWIDRDVAPADELDSLPGVLSHLNDAWNRRDDGNVLLVHYADLVADLDGEMRRIADRLGIAVPAERWEALVEAATFAQMRARANDLVPDPAGILKDRDAFFRRGGSGAGRELLTDAELAHYFDRAASMASPDMLAWLHR